MRIRFTGERVRGQMVRILVAKLLALRTFDLVVSATVGAGLVATGLAEVVDADQELDP